VCVCVLRGSDLISHKKSTGVCFYADIVCSNRSVMSDQEEQASNV